MEKATLGIEVKTNGIKDARAELKTLESQAERSHTAAIKLAKGMEQPGSAAQKLAAKVAPAVGEMNRLTQAGNALSNVMTGLSRIAPAAGSSLAAVGGVALAIANNVARSATEVSRLSTVSNTSTRDFQRWAYAASRAGIEQGKLADILKDVQDKAGDFLQTGGGEMADFFEKVAPLVGVTAEQFRNLSGPEALQLYVSSLEGANLSQSEMTFYLEAIANDATLLLPLLKDNGEAIRTLGDEAERLGVVMSDELINQSKVFKANMAQLTATVDALKLSVGNALIPAISQMTSELVDASQAGMSLSEALIGIGLSDFSKGPAEQIAGIREEMDVLMNGDWTEKSLFGLIAPEKVMEQLQKRLKYWQLQLERINATSKQAAGGATSADDAQTALRIERQITNERTRLMDLLAVKHGQASKEILLDGEARHKAEIARARELATEYQKAYDEASQGAKNAAAEASALLKRGSDANASRAQQAESRRDRNLSSEEIDAKSTRRASDLVSEARTASVFAQNASIDKRAQDAQRYAERALDLSKQAAEYSNDIGDNETAARLLEQIGQIEQAASEAQAKVKQQEQAAFETEAQKHLSLLQQQRAELDGLQSLAIDADITKAMTSLKNLENELEQLQDRTVTVTVRTVNTGGATGSFDVAPEGSFAHGGELPGDNRGDRSDHVLYWGTPGEHVIQRPAVRYYGRDFVDAVNKMRLPKFGFGGELSAPNVASSALPNVNNLPEQARSTLVVPGVGTFPIQTTADVEEQMMKTFRMAALRRGSRR